MCLISVARSKAGVVRHLGQILAGLFFLLGLFLISYGLCLASGPAAADLLLNLGTEIIGIALTVGLIDFLISWSNSRGHIDSVRPAVQDFIERLDQVSRSYRKVMEEVTEINRDGLDRYSTVLRQADSSCVILCTLLANHKAEVAMQLTNFSSQATSLLDEIETAIAALVSASINRDIEVGRVKGEAAQLDIRMHSLAAKLREAYALTARPVTK